MGIFMLYLSVPVGIHFLANYRVKPYIYIRDVGFLYALSLV